MIVTPPSRVCSEGAGGDVAGVVWRDGDPSISRLQRGSGWRRGGGDVAR